MDAFFENIGLLIFLLFLFVQFVASLFSSKKRRPPSTGDPAADSPAGEGATSSAPTSFEEAIRQIQEALQEAGRPQRADAPESDVEALPAGATAQAESFPDEENSLGFQHFEDFEQRGEDHFGSGAHEQYEAAAARREAIFERPLKTDRPTLMEQAVSADALRGQRSIAEVVAPEALALPRSGTPLKAPDHLLRLRKKLRSTEAVQDAYRLHVILGEPRARRRR